MFGRAAVGVHNSMNEQELLPEDERGHFSTHVPRSLIRRVKARAAMEDREVADIVTAALLLYLDSHEAIEGQGNLTLK